MVEQGGITRVAGVGGLRLDVEVRGPEFRETVRVVLLGLVRVVRKVVDVWVQLVPFRHRLITLHHKLPHLLSSTLSRID